MRSFLQTGLRRLKMHKSWAKRKILKGSRSEKLANGTAQRAIRANQMTTNAFFEAAWGWKKWYFWWKVLEVIFQNYAPRGGRKHNFEKMWCEKWVRAWKSWKRHLEAYIFDAKSHQGPWGIVFWHLARRVPSEMKSTKISPMVVLRRLGGMRGGAGGRFAGG